MSCFVQLTQTYIAAQCMVCIVMVIFVLKSLFIVAVLNDVVCSHVIDENLCCY